MTWPELVAVALAERAHENVMVAHGWDRQRCRCGEWACVSVSRGLPTWCLSCWFHERAKATRFRED